MRVIKVLSLLLGLGLLFLAVVLGVAGFLGGGGGGGSGAGELGRTLYCKDHVMTVAYKAYGNPEAADGKYWLAKLVLDNSGKGPLKDVKVSYRIPRWLEEWSTPEVTPVLWPGQTYVLPIYPPLPSKVAELRTRTTATVEVKISFTNQGKSDEVVEKRNFQLLGVNEIEYTSLPLTEVMNWYDLFDNYELLAAYCMDQDDAVQMFLGKVGEVHGGVSTADNAEKVATLLAKIYELQRKVGMSYVAAKGFPEKVGDVETINQNVRLPREVIQNNSGLCIELALLMCSLCDAGGAHSKLVMIPGHAYALIQADNGDELAFECTGVGEGRYGKSMDWKQALKTGMDEIKQVRSGQKDGIIIDLHEFQQKGIRPPELTPLDKEKFAAFLNGELANSGMSRLPGAGVTADNTTGGPQPVAPPVTVTIPFPTTWVTDAPQLTAFCKAVPACKFFAADPAGDKYVQWFYYGGKDTQAFQKGTLDWAKKAGLTYNFDSTTSLAKVGQSGATRQDFTIDGGPGGQYKGELYIVDTKGGPVFIVYACSASSDLRAVIDASLPQVIIR